MTDEKKKKILADFIVKYIKRMQELKPEVAEEVNKSFLDLFLDKNEKKE